MFKEERDTSAFEWTMLGQIDIGRPNLGFTTDVAVYRLMQFTLRDVLIRRYGVAAADEVFYAAGETAGKQFYENGEFNFETHGGVLIATPKAPRRAFDSPGISAAWC